jgi:hypothetical protein
MSVSIVGSNEPEFASAVKPSNAGYGENGFHGASSTTGRVSSALADEISKGDSVLNRIASGGGPGKLGKDSPLAAYGNRQQRDVSDKQYPASHGMRTRNHDANPTIPGALVPDEQGPIRQPG